MNKVRNFFIAVGVVIVCVALYMVVSVSLKKPQPAIDFTATSQSGVQFTLSDNYGKSGTVLIFIDPEVEGSLVLLDKIIANKKTADIIVPDMQTATEEAKYILEKRREI